MKCSFAEVLGKVYILFIELLDKRIFVPRSVEVVLPNVTRGLMYFAFKRTE